MHSKTCLSAQRLALLLGFLPALMGQTSVLTQHNDISRTGQNVNETILTPSNVNANQFGKIFSVPVDGEVLAQPLYLPKLAIGGALHNVVFAATEHDSVYAFDADSGGTPLWQASLLTAAHGANPGATTDPQSDTGCTDIPVEFGITGTPVIDPVSGTLYVVSLTFENNYAVERLHALDIGSGLEKFGGPVVIKASVPGTGTGSSNGMMTFDPKWEMQRAGLLLINGTVYVAFGSHCDFGPFHGWLMAYNATTLAQTAVFLTTPNGEASGIWMSGAGLAADIQGGIARMFVATGNGTYDATTPYTTNLADYGDDILRLNLSNGITVDDAFTPKDQAVRAGVDMDLGSGGPLILPDQPGPYPHLLVETGKGAEIYLVNRDSMGGYSTTANNVVQEIDEQDQYVWGMPAYWNGNLYVWAAEDFLHQFSIANGLISQTAIASAPYFQTTGLGSTPSVSANGTGSGILWVIDSSQPTQILYAFDATNVATTLWSSAGNPTRDAAGTHVKFPVPTIANGKVYIGSADQLMVYGLLPVPDFMLSASSSAVSVTQGASSQATVNVAPINGFSGGVVLSAANLPAGVSVVFAASSTGTSSVATFTAAASATPGTYPVTITGTSGTLTHSISVNVQVIGVPSFSLSASPGVLAVQQGGSVSSAISVLSVNGFTGVPTLSVSGVPSGVTATISTSSSAVTFTASSTAWVGTFSVLITGTYNSMVRTTSIALSVTNGLSLTNVQLVNKATGACFDVNGISKSVGAGIGQWACWGGPNQLWNLTAVASGSYRLTSINSGLTLDISASSLVAAALAIQDTYNSLNSQQWKLQTTSDGYFKVVNGKSGQCLDGVELSVSALVETQQQVCSGVSSQKWSFIPLSNNTPVDLSPSYNVHAITLDGAHTTNGGLDGFNDAFSETFIGSGYSWYGYPFVFGPANMPDAVTSTTVALPNGQYNGLYFLGAAANGPRPNQTFRVNYSDGTATTVQQGISDWVFAPARFPGEQVALTSSYGLLASGAKGPQAVYIYGYEIELDSTRTAVSITLPNNASVNILAITLGRSP